MKNVFVLFCISFLMIFSSCSSDDDSSEGANSDSIIGTWQQISQTFNGEGIDLSECDLMYTRIFNETQVRFISYAGAPCSILDESTFLYNLDGNILTLESIDDFLTTEEILTLNDMTLTIRIEREENDNVTIITFTRQ